MSGGIFSELMNRDNLEKEIIPGLSLQTILVFCMSNEQLLKFEMKEGGFKIVHIGANPDGSAAIAIQFSKALVDKWYESMQLIKDVNHGA